MTLSEEKLKELDAFIAEMPVKYGLPLIEFFNKILEEQRSTETKTSGENNLKGL